MLARRCGRLYFLLVAATLLSTVVVLTGLGSLHLLLTGRPLSPPPATQSQSLGSVSEVFPASSDRHIRQATDAVAANTSDRSTSNSSGKVTAVIERRVACSLWVGHQGKQNEPVFSRCVEQADTEESSARRLRGELLVAPMQANTGDPLTGAYFHIRLEMDESGGRVAVIHENCRPDEVNKTAPEHQQSLRDHIRHEWGPTMLELYVVGPELHAVFLRPLVSASHHPCTYHIRYVVHAAGSYQLYLEWLHTDYHHFLHRQPLWARGLYGIMLGPINQTITQPEPIVHSSNANTSQPTLHRVGELALMPLPDFFTRCSMQATADGKTTVTDGSFRAPQGLGRWVRTGTLSTDWWPRPSYQQQLTTQYTDSAQYGGTELFHVNVTDLRRFLRNFTDCHFADIEQYSYVHYIHSLMQAGKLSLTAQQQYQRAAVAALDYRPSLVPQTVESFHRCFKDVNVVFIGDSHSRHMFNAFIERALSVDEYRAIKDPRRTQRLFEPANNQSSTAAATGGLTAGRRRLTGFVWGKPDSEINPWSRTDPLPLFSSWQCISKGTTLESEMGQQHGHVVADACVWEKGWPEASLPIVHQGLLESDVLFYNFGHWQAANDPTHFPMMDLDHLQRYMDGFFQHWNSTLLSPAMHQRQIERWLAAHSHLASELESNATYHPFTHRLDPLTGQLTAILLGSLSLLDVFREKALWWTSQVYTSHFEQHFFRGSDGRTPARLELYAEVQRAVAARWGIRQYSDTRHVALPFRNCVTPDDFGHVVQPVYEVHLTGLLDKAAQMRQCAH